MWEAELAANALCDFGHVAYPVLVPDASPAPGVAEVVGRGHVMAELEQRTVHMGEGLWHSEQAVGRRRNLPSGEGKLEGHGKQCLHRQRVWLHLGSGGGGGGGGKVMAGDARLRAGAFSWA